MIRVRERREPIKCRHVWRALSFATIDQVGNVRACRTIARKLSSFVRDSLPFISLLSVPRSTPVASAIVRNDSVSFNLASESAALTCVTSIAFTCCFFRFAMVLPLPFEYPARRSIVRRSHHAPDVAMLQRYANGCTVRWSTPETGRLGRRRAPQNHAGARQHRGG